MSPWAPVPPVTLMIRISVNVPADKLRSILLDPAAVDLNVQGTVWLLAPVTTFADPVNITSWTETFPNIPESDAWSGD